MEQRPIFLSLHDSGTPEHPRFIISDQFLRFWTGTGWTTKQHEALLYHHASDACAEMQRLLMVAYTGKPHRRFVAPVTVDVYSDGQFSQRDLQEWLSKVSRLLINSPAYGSGPISGSLGLVNIHWAQMKEERP